jgi:hypothetical protein
MTFYPSKGHYSIEDFNSSIGAVFDTPSLQGIIGGYVTLKSLNTGTSSYINSWNTDIVWTLEDGLYTESLIKNTFDLYTGNLPAGTNTISGSYGIATDTSAWFFETSYPTYISGYGYSGRGDFALGLTVDSPSTVIFDTYADGGEAVTFEFDVSSVVTHSGQAALGGFSATGNNLSGLSPLTGVINHGLLFSDGTRWDYIEVTPDGVRSFNHPEIAIPINLYSPKKIRVGFRGFDLFIATEDGKSVAGYNKFDTERTDLPGEAFAIFGAPSVEGFYVTGGGVLSGSTATVGKSTWDNIKILSNDMAIFELSGTEQLYTTGYATMYTDVFDPNISLNKYLHASIASVPFKGGDTIVAAQYSGVNGWETFDSVTLSTSAIDSLDLTSFPVTSYPRTEGGVDYLSNPIRFRIDQRSTNGDSLPPAVESIEVFTSKSNVSIDMLPDWKQAKSNIKSKVYIQTGTFLTDDPTPQLWTSLLMNTPLTTGQYSNTIIYDESSSIPIDVIGTGEVTLNGPFRSSFKTFIDISRSGTVDSDAYQVFGGQPVFNFFPNPLFSDPFRQINSGETNYYTGLTEGYIAKDVRISNSYTGSHNIYLDKEAVYRPDTQARVNKINSYLGRTSSLNEEYVQNIKVYNNGLNHDGTVGIEAVIPSGIAVGDLKVTFDLQVKEGTGIAVSMIGSETNLYYLPGEFFREYRTVGFPVTSTTDYEFLVKFSIPSGYPAQEYEFNIDNLTVSAMSSSYLSATGLSGYLHQSGVAYTDEGAGPPQKAATVFNSSIYLYSYPESTGTIVSLLNEANRGLEITIDSSGYITANIDTVSNAWATSGLSKFYHELDQRSISSNVPLPLGTWTNLGFLHTADNYTGFSCASDSGSQSHNFTSCNRAYLTIDGHVASSTDMITGWKAYTTDSNNAYPYSSYVDLTGSVSAVFASGLHCEIDAIHLQKPPIADVETDLTLKGARAYVPYIVPDAFYLPNNISDNLIITGTDERQDVLIGSCYNFSTPYYTEWDRGNLKNHLVYYGSISRELNCPYEGYPFYSTRFNSSSYGIAPYSSSYERLQNTTGQLGIDGVETPYNQGNIRVAGWLYPRTTGSFCTLYQDSSNYTGARLELCVDTSNSIVVNKYDVDSNSVIHSSTGHTVSLSGWTFVNVAYEVSGDYISAGDENFCTIRIHNESGVTNSPVALEGPDFGIRYQSETLSEYQFGGTADCNLFNWLVLIPSTGEINLDRNLHGSHAKSGRYQAITENNSIFTGRQNYYDYDHASLYLPASTGSQDRYFGLALHNSYDTLPKLNGIVAYDDKPFREVNSYSMMYNTQSMTQAFGTTSSAIRLGNQVPKEGVNIARISSPTYSVASSIANIDLSDTNTNNLISYRNGNYDVGEASSISFSSITGYKGINESIYSGRYDVVISGQVLSADVEITTIPITDQKTNTYDKAYYYYLVGRGTRAVKSLGSFPHYTGQIYDYSTGQIVDNYNANLQRIKSNIKLKDSKGQEINNQTYPYDVAISAYTPDDLYFASLSGEDIFLDNIGEYTSGSILPDSIFTVILLTNKNKLPNESVFIHYEAYDIYSKEQFTYKEIVNPQPIFREKYLSETPTIGHYSLDLNENNYYDLQFYGLATGYSGQL